MKILVVLSMLILIRDVTCDTPYNITMSERGMLDVLCPKTDICNITATSADLTPNGLIRRGLVSCCQGCSCHEDCWEKLNCCFPEKDIWNSTSSTAIHDCLYTRLAPSGEDIPSTVRAYWTITEAPPSGCIQTEPIRITSNTFLYPTCGEEYFTALESYFPVYSPETGQIYKNMLCARCHNINNTRPFDPLLICEFQSNGMPMSFSEQFSIFENGLLSPKCYVEYVYRDPMMISTQKCYKSVIDTCESNATNDFDDVSKTIDRETIRSLCKTGIYSPVLHDSKVYRNSFCLLCRQATVNDLLCLDDSIERTSDFNFVNILNTASLVKHLAKKPEMTPHPEICMAGESQEDVQCRRIYCSSGKIRDKKGDCIFVTNSWKTGVALVHLKLIPTVGEPDIRKTIKATDNEGLYQAIREGQPWSDDWFILTLMKRQDDSTCREIAELDLAIASKPDSLESLYHDIKTSVDKQWTIKLNGSSDSFVQAFHDYRGDSVAKNGNWLPFWSIHQMNLTESHPYFGCDSVTWKQIFTESRFRIRPVYIKKLILCQQVRLSQGEFVLDPRGLYLQSNLTRRILYESEYDLVQLDDDIQYASVCLADTILSVKTNAGTRSFSTNMTIIIVLALISLTLIVSAN